MRCARSFKSSVKIIKNGRVFSASSILDILTANLDCGSKMLIEAVGPDADMALKRLGKLLHEFKAQEDAEQAE